MYAVSLWTLVYYYSLFCVIRNKRISWSLENALWLYEITVPCITSVNEDTVINCLHSFIKYILQNIIETLPLVIKSHEGQKNWILYLT